MQTIKSTIQHKKIQFSNHHFFHILKNENLTIDQRLKFLPDLAHFIMSFSDLNKYVLPYANPKNKYEEAINLHCKEDANHWPWYLYDLKKLNLDQSQLLSDTLKYLWGDKMPPSRKLSYELVSLTSNQCPFIRYVAIEVMEATGNVVFNVLNEITKEASLNLKFCSEIHLAHETGHTIGVGTDVFDDYPTSTDTKLKSIIVIEKSFNAFAKFMDQLENKLKE